MYCNKCGAIIEVDDKFCRACGASCYSTKKIGEQNPWIASTPPPPPEKPVKAALIETPEENSVITFIKKWAYRIIILIAASMAAVIAKPFGIMLANQYQESKVWKEASEEIDKKKIEMKLPKRIDVNTQVSDVFVSGRELHYEYLINDMNISEDNRKDINSFALTSFNKALCDNALITKYHGTSVYTYKFPNGTLTYKFTKTDCRNPH